MDVLPVLRRSRARILLFAFPVVALAIINIIWSSCQHKVIALDDSMLLPHPVKATVDEEATDCTGLLENFRGRQIKETKDNIKGTFTKAHIILATADQNRTEAFYVSTHEKAIGKTRSRAFICTQYLRPFICSQTFRLNSSRDYELPSLLRASFE